MKKRRNVLTFIYMISNLVIFLFYDNAQPYIAIMTWQKLTDLRYEICPIHYIFLISRRPTIIFSSIWTLFLCQKIFYSREVEVAFKDFLASKLLELFLIIKA